MHVCIEELLWFDAERRQWILSQSPCIETLLKEFPSLKKIRFVSLRNVHSHIMALCVTHIGGAVIIH